MASKNILAIVLAGGEGSRLRPLTAEHAKPALPFAGGCRIVDFVLSNLINSGISSIYVLAKYKPQSLIRHIASVWRQARDSNRFVESLLPEKGDEPFLGTADAVFRNLRLVERHRPDLVAVFAADHVYRMDVRQMVNFHVAREAEISVAAVPVPIHEAPSFGVISSDHDGRIVGFQEKPPQPAALPSDPSRAFASMGNYLFNPGLLVDLLHSAKARGEMDFGRHVLPRAARDHRTFAYDFSSNHVPGLTRSEERTYWRDVGTLDAYTAAHRDVLGPEPRFCLDNTAWPIRGATLDAEPREQAPGKRGWETLAVHRPLETSVEVEHAHRQTL